MAELLALADDEDRRAWADLRLGYTETFGDPGLREAIAATYTDVLPSDVLCFAGAEEGIYLAMCVLLGPGDHAVVVTPNYQSAETVPLSLCEVTGVALDAGRDFALDLGAIEAALRPDTRVVSVNFPNNPTGKLIPAADLRRLAELCDERGIHLFGDEVYRGLELDPARVLPQAADRLVAEAGVLLLPGSLYRSELTGVPADRFRLGVGRRGAQEALDAFATWLRARRSG